MNHTIYEDLKYYFPFVAEDAVKYHEVDMYTMIIDLIDGSSILYDNLEKTIRVLPNDSSEMSEEECRREFSHRLKRIMFVKRINQNELAKKTGISNVLLSRYMTGKTTPSFYNVDRICKALSCSVDDLRYTR